MFALTCPYCGGEEFLDPDFNYVCSEDAMGDEITCATCLRSFVVSGNSFKEVID